jgi:hypothetical protein
VVVGEDVDDDVVGVLTGAVVLSHVGQGGGGVVPPASASPPLIRVAPHRPPENIASDAATAATRRTGVLVFVPTPSLAGPVPA